MENELPDEQTPRPRGKKGFRLVFAAYLAITIPFIVWTALLVIRQVFDDRVPSRGEVLPALPAECEAGLRELGSSLDTGLRAAMWSDDEESAARRFTASIDPVWKDREKVERACRGDIAGTGAYAAIVRQRGVQEGWARRHARETVAAAGGARRFLPLRADAR